VKNYGIRILILALACGTRRFTVGMSVALVELHRLTFNLAEVCIGNTDYFEIGKPWPNQNA
jgi:hypothetical protein